MRVRLVSPGNRMPAWIEEGFGTYQSRIRGRVHLELKELPLAARGKRSLLAVEDEGQRMLAAVGSGDRIVALDERGRNWSTRDLATRMEDWLMDARDVSLLVGGPDGLSAACRDAAVETWSLSRMTLPHGLVRVIVAEQLYRAWSILENHPYHRD